MTGAAADQRVAELERGVRHAGVPLFIEGYSASTDVFNRVVPLLGLIAKALPLLLIFALLSFTTQEAWQIFPGVTTPIYFLIIGLFVELGSLVLVVRIPAETRQLERETSTHREEFLTELTGEMRASFEARAEYCRPRGATA